MKQTTKETLAELMHDTWSHWIRYLLDDACVRDSDGNAVLPKVTKERWQRLVTTPYRELPECAKMTCRNGAQRWLDVLRSHRLPSREGVTQ